MTTAAPAPLDQFLRSAAAICGEFRELRKQSARLMQIAETSAHPFTVAVVGRMKTGKSTLINSLVGHALAVSDVEEATATINWIRYGTGAQKTQAIVHWRDGRNEVVPLSRIVEWSGKDPSVIGRVQQTAWIDFFADAPQLQRLQIVDTPGTGSAVEIHEQVVREFLNPRAISDSLEEGMKADAILYVTPPVGRESDSDTLSGFEQGRLPGSGPYNSVCVLHKWDGLESPDPFNEAVLRANDLRKLLKGTVADVIPVSGPLALAAKDAPDEFLAGMLNTIAAMKREDCERVLRSDERWDKDPARRVLRLSYPEVPWSSFTLIARLCLAEPTMQPADLRTSLLRKSRIQDLEQFLQDRFAARADIIKRSQTLRKAQVEIESAVLALRQLRTEFQSATQMADLVLSQFTTSTPAQAQWLRDTVERSSRTATLADDCLRRLSQEWDRQKWEMTALNGDLQVCEFVEQNPEIFSTKDKAMILGLCDILASPKRRSELGRGTITPLGEISVLIDKYRLLQNTAKRQHETLYGHIVDRLTEAAALIAGGDRLP